MTLVLYVVLTMSVVVFVAGTVARAVGYARAPLHLRWELYPVPHEAADRAAHGGSYFETADWWTRPSHFNVAGELRAMLEEALFLKALREFNLAMWLRSFPFHFGLYLLIATAALVVGAAVTMVVAPGLLAGRLGALLSLAYRLTGVVGLTLAIAGAAGLLHRRLTDDKLRRYTTPGDLFNLAAFIGAFGVLGAGYLLRPDGAPGGPAIVVGMLTWDTGLEIPGLLAFGLACSGLLAAYIPFTHMSHFVGKYFTYHAIRWDDAANRPGGRLERKLAEYLTYRPTWSAPHVKADGVRTWADVATTNPTEKAPR
jgi:nitrate reductase gamma subunit